MVIATQRKPGYGPHARHRQAGITFLIVLFAMAIAGIALAGTGVLWQLEGRREKEKELLFIGEEYRRAIDRYYDKTPGEAKQYPEKLEDLLQDKRFPMPVHHLRRLYRDPMTEKVDWELIKQQGRITGIASKSQEEPIKIAGFAAGQEEFEGAESYAKWRFISNGNSLPPAPVAAPAPG
jgi:type II secretory pathway pseudopilin PulG